MNKSVDEVLNGILQAADKHPNSHASKLIRMVEADPTQKNVVLLLIELAEHAEYATDFNISLKYYLDLFERLGERCEVLLSEAGLLLHNSSKIYSRRVDYVHDLIERQILTLSNADKDITDSNRNEPESPNTVEKPKRGRKRLLETPKDPYEIELVPKKIRKLTPEKRFATSGTANQSRPQTSQFYRFDTDEYIHPTGWIHSKIVDLENEDEVDSKRNYKMFTHHIEHRYNTLVPDINFRLHFMVKDFIDEEQEELEESSEQKNTWPPLSEEYVERYLNLENRIIESRSQSIRGNELMAKKGESRDTDAEDANNSDQIDNVHAAENTTEDLEKAEAGGNENDLCRETKEVIKEDAVSVLTPSNGSTAVENEVQVETEGDIQMHKQDDSLISSQNADTDRNNQTLANGAINSDTNSANEFNNSDITNESTNIITDSTASTALDSTTNTQNTSVASEGLNTSFSTHNETQQYDSALGSSILDSITSVDDFTVNIEAMNSETSLKNQSLCSNDKQPEDENEDIETKSSFEEEGITHSKKSNNEGIGLIEGSSDRNNMAAEAEDDNKNRSIDLPPATNRTHDDTQISLNEVRIRLPHLDDEGVFFSDLDERDLRMLSPTVIAMDIFPHVPNKESLTIVVDAEIRAMLNLSDDEPETYNLPVENRPQIPTQMILNIMKIPEKHLRRRLLFKLGTEYDLYTRARTCKRTRPCDSSRHNHQPKQMKWFHLNDTDMSAVHVSPPNSPGHNTSEFYGFSDFDDDDNAAISDFLGFPEDELSGSDSLFVHRLSRDSGVDGVDILAPEKPLLQTIEEHEKEDNNNVKNNGSIEDENKKLDTDNEVSKEGNNNTSGSGTTADETTEQSQAKCSVNPTNKCEQIEEQTPTAEADFLSIANISDTRDKFENSDNIEKDLESIAEVQTPTADIGSLSTEDIPDTSNSEKEIETIDRETMNSENVQQLDANTNLELIASGDNAELFNDTAEDIDVCENNNLSSDEVTSNVDMDLERTFTDIDLNSTKTKIQKWHEYLQPILARSRERHHFDVFNLGTEIMYEFRREDMESTPTIPPCISFQDVMQTKDPTYVSRYFLSSLLLANEGNIRINVENKNPEQPSDWKDIKFEFLSNKRHTVSIEDNIGLVRGVAGPSTKNATKHKATASDPLLPGATTEQCELLKVNLDVVKPFKQVEKLPSNGDDYDSGIYSSEEMM